ncbi:MAG: AtpZ/AtpI family protein [Candidatus Dormibacteria bacterium]
MSAEGDPQGSGRGPGAVAALSLVGVFSITVCIGVVAGVLLDQHLRTLPLFTLLGLALGLVGGTLATYRGLVALGRPRT